MNHVRSFVLAVLAGAALMLVPRAAHAQQAITVDFSGGIAVPGGDLSDFAGAGPGFTAGVNFRVHDMISIRTEGGADIFSTEDFADPTGLQSQLEGPDVTLTRLDVGLILHAVQPSMDSGLWVDADIGGGYHIITTDNFEFQSGPTRTTSIDVSEGYLGAKGGLTVGYHFSDAVSAFVGGDAYLVPGDEEDLSGFGDLQAEDGSALEAPETLWSFPVQAGFRLHFQP